MAYTFANFKSQIRELLFPAGESSNLRISHDKAMLDALIDLQQNVECLCQDNTTVVPHCATFYNCGLTVLDAPRGRIKKVSVIESEVAGSPAGTEIISDEFDVTLEGDPTAPTSIGSVSAGGAMVIKTSSDSGECGSAKPLAYHNRTVTYVNAGKQYFNVSIIYTDLDGTTKTVTKRVPIAECNNIQYEKVNIASNTAVFVSIVPVNLPETTGSATITVSVNEPATYIEPAKDEWCSEIEYRQIDAHYVQMYFNRARFRYCAALFNFFDIPFMDFIDCGTVPRRATPAKDIGLAPGLPLLPLGYHYAQADTDRRHRSRAGLWAIERGKLFLVPWIQSTEKVVIKWDGVKREWSDDDPIDTDPLLRQAVTEWVRSDHARNWDRDYDAAQVAQAAYNEARAKMWHECREETRIRGNEPSLARSSASTSVTLIYNTKQIASMSCPTGTVGDSVTATVEAGTVASSISQDDANAKAMAQAQAQAQNLLVCREPLTVYSNTPQSYTAYCLGVGSAPNPDGSPVTVNIPAGQFTSTVSQADANSQALASARAQAEAQLDCTFWNSEQSYTASCPSGQTGSDVTKTVAEHTYSSTVSQADADAQALADATNQANSALVCSGGGGGGNTYYNTPQTATRTANCSVFVQSGGVGSMQTCSVVVTALIPANRYSSIVSQADANAQAINYVNQRAQQYATAQCAAGHCGNLSLSV